MLLLYEHCWKHRGSCYKHGGECRFTFPFKTCTNCHVDYEDDSIHGFRVLIPLNNSSYMIVEDKEVELEMNQSYFVDVTKPHAAWSKAGRVVLSFQMDCDILL